MRRTLPIAFDPWQRWPRTAEEARALQRELAGLVQLEGEIDRDGPIAGVDVHYDALRERAFAAVACLDRRTLELTQSVVLAMPIGFPYITGLLSFREAPPILAALRLLSCKPALLMVDGQGIAHPRRFGLACHLGVATGIPAIGVAKSRLTGKAAEPGERAGSVCDLLDKGRTIGAVLRTRERCRPLYVSIGHGVTLENAVALVLGACRGFRLPEPTRLADRLSRMH